MHFKGARSNRTSLQAACLLTRLLDYAQICRHVFIQSDHVCSLSAPCHSTLLKTTRPARAHKLLKAAAKSYRSVVAPVTQQCTEERLENT